MDNNESLLVVHSTGTGKTLTAVTVSQCFLDKDPKNVVVFVGPSGLLTNFEKEMEKYGVHNNDRYVLYSFDMFLREAKALKPVLCGKNTLLIIDEAHNLRNIATDIERKDKSESLTRVMAVLNCALQARKRLLLTATPFVNSIEDFAPLINMLYGERIFGSNKQVKAKLASFRIDEKLLLKYLRNKIDIVTAQDDEFFPEKIIKYLPIPMSKEYYIKYQNAIDGEIIKRGEEEGKDVFTFSNPEKFYNGHRRAVNIAGNEYFSSKLEKIIPIIKNQKTVVFTNWLDFGITPIVKTLKKYKITYKIITGSTTKSQRQEIVNEYNNNSFQVLVITKAGSEGIDLHEVRNLIVLDPVWNYAGLEQIMGRAARYKSHINLPPSKRNVKVFLLVSTEPNISTIALREGETTDSGDKILYDIIKKKKAENRRITDLLKDKCSLR